MLDTTDVCLVSEFKIQKIACSIPSNLNNLHTSRNQQRVDFSTGWFLVTFNRYSHLSDYWDGNLYAVYLLENESKVVGYSGFTEKQSIQ